MEKRLVSATVLAVVLAASSAAQQPQPPKALPPKPSTAQTPANDAQPLDSDEQSIRSLLARGLFDQAEALAVGRMNAVALPSEDAARWAVTLSAVRLQKLLRAPMGDQPAHLAAATEPLDQISSAYPEHRRAAWLRFQRAVVDFAVARRLGLLAQVTPDDQAMRLAALAPLLQTTSVLQELEQELVAEITAAFGRRDRSAWIDELMALRNAVAVQRVEVLLARGDLFPLGSDDYLAAAGQADAAAREALALVRQDPARRAALVRMRCEALLRMGQPDQAAELLAPLLAESDAEQADDATLALAVRIAIEREQMERAQKLLAAHYGDRLGDAPPSPELDLARLRYLITMRSRGEASGNEQRQIGDWIDAIGLRGGDFARRRAEALAMEALENATNEAADPRIAFAKSAALLRQGQSLAAAELLDATARQSTEAEAAHRLAAAGAAAYVKAEQVVQAADLLRDTARAHDGLPQAADLHLQSAVLLDRLARESAEARGDSSAAAGHGDVSPSVDELLRQTIVRWPGAASSAKARRWLTARLLSSGRLVESAMAASPIENPAASDQEWDVATRRWIDALMSVPLLREDFSVSPHSEQVLRQALEFLPAEPAAAQRCRSRLIVLFAPPEYLAMADVDPDDEPWVHGLLQVRRGESDRLPRSGEAAERERLAAVQRLVADGMADAARQASLARVILALTQSDVSCERAQALLWSGDWQAADRLLDLWIAGRKGSEAHMAAAVAARLLAMSPQDEVKQRALHRYTAAAAQLTQGTVAWHEVKLATIELMSALGQRGEAARLARYILLTRRPEDPTIELAYRRLAED